MSKGLRSARLGRWGLVAACAVAAGALATPAHAGSGTSFTVPLIGTPPTVDGAIGTPEWDMALSFPATFGPYAATVRVARTATDLYLAVVVADASGTPGDVAFYFDNRDNGVLDTGEDLIGLNHGGGGTDWYSTGVSGFSSYLDTFGSGTNDVVGAETYANQTTVIELSHPLCSSDSQHDFCFTPPPYEDSPFSKLGFTISYSNFDRSVEGQYPVGIVALDRYANLVIPPPDVTPPTVTLDAPSAGFVGPSTDFAANAIDTGTGVDHVTFEYSGTGGNPWLPLGTAGAPATDGKWHALWANPPPDGNYIVRAHAFDKLGNEAATGAIEVTLDATPPQISLNCRTATGSVHPCKWFTAGADLPVGLQSSIVDTGAGFTAAYATTDRSDPLTSPTATRFDSGLQFSVSTYLRVGVRDTVGNASYAVADIGIDTTPPPAPRVLVQPAAGGFPTSHGTATEGGVIAWYNPTVDGSFTLSVPLQDDPESGIDSVVFGGFEAAGWTMPPRGAPNEQTYAWTAGAGRPSSIDVRSTNGAGVSGPGSRVDFSPDQSQPAGGISCVPAACLNPDGPVHVTVSASDGNQSGVNVLHYTTDGSEASLTNGTPIQPGGSFDVTTPSTQVAVWGIDNVGNAGTIASASVSGTPPAPPDPPQSGPTFTVNTADDHADSAGCTVADCTLREAITAANQNVDAATVAFAVPGPTPTIRLRSSLPRIGSGITVDATTQLGAIGPAVVLDGSAVEGSGLVVGGDNSVVKGFDVRNFLGIGIWVLGSHDQVLDNYVGLDQSGLERSANHGDGIRVQGGDGNVVSGNAAGGNGGHGIFLLDATHSTVQSNTSGTNASGTAAIPNGVDGIAVDGGSNNTIGGAGALGNIASGNTNQGISLFGGFNSASPTTTGNVVYGNSVGVGADNVSIPNGHDGIRVYSGFGNVIGGVGTGQANVVSGNGDAGVAVYLDASTGNEIRGNSIYGNGGLGIDLRGDGITVNDLGDGDSGPNGLQNFPVFDPPVATGGSVTITGTLNSVGNEPFAIDAFANSACDASGYGEGELRVGSANVTTDDAGNATFTLVFEIGSAGVPAGVTLTATDLALKQTSEFSQCQAPVEGRTTGATITLSSDVRSAEAGASTLDFSSLSRSAYLPAPPPAAPIASSPIASSPIASSPIASSPIASSPIASSPIASSPIASSPIASSPIASSGFTSTNLQQNALGGVPLAQLALKAPLTWAGVLGRPVVEQAMTFAQALDLSPRPAGLAALTVGDVDWARSGTALASLGIGAFVFGPVKLSDIAIGGATTPAAARAAWCTAIDNLKGYQCSAPDSLTDTTVMSLSLAGAPIASSGVDAAPIASSHLSDSPIASSPIASSTLQGTPIASSKLSDVNLTVSVLGSIPLSAVLATDSPLRQIPSASVPMCAGCVGTLGAAFDAHLVPATLHVRDLGAALNGFTIGDLKAYPGVTVGNIGPGLPASLTLHDLFAALFAHIPFNPDTMPLDGVQAIAEAGGLVTYSADFTLTGSGTTTAQLVASIAPGASFVLGSTKLYTNGVGAPYGDPGVVDGDIAWQLNGLHHAPTTYRLTFQLRPSLRLGIDTTTVKLLPFGAAPHSADPVPVTVTDTFESGGGNDTPATAKAIEPGKAYLSFEQTQADTDWYSLPVPATGTSTTFALSHLSHDQDLVVYAPAAQPLRSSPIASSPIASSPIASSPTPDTRATLQQSTSVLQPVAVQDIPIASSQLAASTIAGISDNTGTSSETVSVVATGAQQGGSYLVHVVNSDPIPSSLPYMLRTELQTPSPLPPCTARPAFANAGQGVAGTLPGASVPASAKTIVLVDYKRYGDLYGTGALNTLKAELATFVARPEVAGVVLPVEGSAAVQTAYDGWDASPCSPENANNVVRAIIANVVDPFRASHPNVKFLTIVGGDDVLPFPRVVDNTIQANETSYRDTLMNGAQVNNQLVGTAASAYMLTDDVWSAFNPTPFLGGQLYLPQWATGRLVESPAQIDHQIATYNATGGLIAPTTQLSVGYSFLADSAAAVQQALNPFAAGGPGSLISDIWTHADLLAKLQLGQPSPAIVALNTHFDHHRALPANGNVNDLFDSRDVNASATVAQTTSELGRLIFSIGCHSALSVPDSLYSWPFSLDWAQADMSAGAVARVGNTTFGYGDTDVIGYSEQVEVDFAKRLNQMTLGEALLYAKQQYFADLGVFGPYEQKATNALTFYGLPMQRIGNPASQLPAAVLPTITDPATGLTALPIDSQVTFGAPIVTGGGQYFAGPDGVDATNNRPFEPKKIVPDITQPGTFPHGFLITDLGIDAQLVHVKIARSVAVPDSPGLTPPLSSQVGYPSNLGRVSGFLSPTGPRQQLVLTHGQFLSDTDSDTAGLGTQTNFGSIKGLVLYSSSSDAFPPQLSNPRVTRVGNLLAISVDATDTTDTNGTLGTVKEVVVVYYEPGSHTSHTVYLLKTPGTSHWSGAGPLTSAATQEVNYFMQGVDASANVGLSVHKVAAAPVTLPQQGGGAGGSITFSISGTQAGSGWYAGAASVTISAPAGDAISYSVDGAALRPYISGSPVLVSGDGLHLVDATAEAADGTLLTATTAVPIDQAVPTIRIDQPTNGLVILSGDVVRAAYSCSDGGSGIAAGGCRGTVAVGAAIDSTAGTKTFTITATDNVGRTATAFVTYTVWQWTGFFNPVNNPPVLNVANAGSAVPVKFQLGRNRGLTFLASGYPASQKVACDTDAPLDTIEQTVTAGSSSLQYDAGANMYTYVWKTDKSWSGTCRDFTLKLPSGSYRTARFKFK